MKNIVKFFLYVNRFFRRKKGGTIFIESHFPSGSNTWFLLHYFKDCDNCEVIRWPELNFNSNIKNKIEMLQFHLEVSKYDVIISTNGYKKFISEQILIELWHGTPIKGMAFMTKNFDRKIKYNMDYLITNSKLESTLLASTMHVEIDRHKILGSPRLDAFYKCENDIKDLVKDKRNEIPDNFKILLYMPTFRDIEKNSNLFYFDWFDTHRFNTFLKNNHLILIIKKHYLDSRNYNDYSNIISINNEDIINKDLDFYCYLNSTDLLITDYSSIAFDYTLTKNPIIFTPGDKDTYSHDRGFLFEPYSMFTQSTVANNQEDLELSIINSINNNVKINYNNKLFNDFLDGNNTIRVKEFIDSVVKNGSCQ